jgi:hypothetical protein
MSSGTSRRSFLGALGAVPAVALQRAAPPERHRLAVR